MTSISGQPKNKNIQSLQPARPRVLMCEPTYFTVSYRINPWMYPEKPTDNSLALRQWKKLYKIYVDLGFYVELISPVAGLPDMVYSANGGFVLDGIAYGAKFHYEERKLEGPAYMEWFQLKGFDVRRPLEVNEGEGDFLLAGNTILAASGFRSDTRSHDEIGDIFGREVLSLKLVNPNFYHLDTALAVIDDETIAYLPSAFDDESLEILETRFPDAILVSEADAAQLGINCFSDGHNVVMAEQAKNFSLELANRGFHPIGVNLSELLLGGGGVKCCTLELRS